MTKRRFESTQAQRESAEVTKPIERDQAGVVSLVFETWRYWHRGRAPGQSAALAFYTLLALGPVLVVVFAIAGLVFGQEATKAEIVIQIESLLGPVTAEALVQVLDSAARPSYRGLTGALGFVALLLGSTAVFNQLQESVNSVWGLERQQGSKVRKFLGKRLLSFGLVVSIGVLLLLSLILSTAVAAVRSYVERRQEDFAVLFPSLDFVLSAALMTVLFALIFRLLPDVRVALKDVWVGAAVTAVFFSLGKFVIGAYLGRSNYLSVYGVAGSVVVSLLWIYYSWMVLLLGAGFTRAWSLRHQEPPELRAGD